jgi:hypothetical protein
MSFKHKQYKRRSTDLLKTLRELTQVLTLIFSERMLALVECLQGIVAAIFLMQRIRQILFS